MKKTLRWVLLFVLAALISHHPLQIGIAAAVLLALTGVAAVLKLVVAWVRRDGREG